MSETSNLDKELYQALRRLSCEELWTNEVTRFDQAPPRERLARVALIRAIGVVFSESGTADQKDRVKRWLRRLIHDPSEKIRRYAIAALPKIGAGPLEETEFLSLFRTTTIDREKKFLRQALEKIGGTATLAELEPGSGGALLQTEQRVRASVARAQAASIVRMDAAISDFAGLQIHLRCRRGLESILRAEVEEYIKRRGTFHVTNVRTGLVAMAPISPFKLADIYTLRCFALAGFFLGAVGISRKTKTLEELASMIASSETQRILKTLTQGPIRYRLDFLSEGHQRGAVRELANKVYAKCPDILNDARNTPWEITIRSGSQGRSVELFPNLTPDPRFYYRGEDVPAASHPPLAACLARLAGRVENDLVWDPFCGSGLELIEMALLGGAKCIYGTDRSAAAISIAERNFAGANLKEVQAKFICCDFRNFAANTGLGPRSLSLIITNPPLGKRVPIPNLRELVQDLFQGAVQILRPGGRLVFVNPVRLDCPERSLKLQSRQVIDLGGFDCRLEKYRKLA